MVTTLGQFIRLRRQVLGLTQVELAARVECDQTFISQLERDRIKRLPPPAQIRRLTTALETTLAELFRSLGYLEEDESLEPLENLTLLARILEYTEQLDLGDHHKELLRRTLSFWRSAREDRRSSLTTPAPKADDGKIGGYDFYTIAA